MSFEHLDNFIDAVFVINEQKEIVYCNESAATLSESSVKRLTKKKPIYEVIKFSSEELFTMPNGTVGFDHLSPFKEIFYEVVKSGHKGRTQVLIQPLSDKVHWLVIAHDVTLEEQLQKKYLQELNQKEDVIVDLKKAKKELEHYSKNLEHMVEERTAEVKKANVMLSAIMNSLGQGFLVFDSDGQCGNIYTKACETILETNPSGKRICEVLKLNGGAKEDCDKWLQAVFSEVLPFETLKGLGPTKFEHSEDRHIIIDYFPIKNESNKLENVVLVATDKTSEYNASQLAEKERQYSNMVIRLVKNKEQFSQFLQTIEIRLDELSEIFKSEKNFDYNQAFRILHTLEGESGVFGCSEISLAAKSAQNWLTQIHTGENSFENLHDQILESQKNLDNTFKEFMDQNDDLFKKLGVLEGKVIEVKEVDVENYYHLLQKNKISSLIIQDYEEKFLKESVEKQLNYLDQLAEKVAARIGKKVNPIQINGGKLKVFSQPYQDLFSSFVHSIRNAIDHGIEYPEERLDVGKDEVGTIAIDCQFIEKAHKKYLQLVIRDDGKGIDPEMIRNKIYEKTQDEKILQEPDEGVIQHIFDAGFSSKSEVSEFSGRGVGMDAIKNEVLRLKGSVVVHTKKGVGTQIVIEVPDTHFEIYQLSA